MARFNSVSAGDYELTLAKSKFIRQGDFAEYIDKKFEKTNMSRFSQFTPVVPGVVYKAEQREYEKTKTHLLEVVGFHHITCLDWDWPNEGHKTDRCVTIKNYSDVKQRLVDSGLTWRTYITPGGIRAFCLSKGVHPSVMPKLDADPLYIDLCKKTEVYWARVCPKKERPYDWVAEYIETIGNDVDQNLLDLVEKYHDNQILDCRGYMELSEEQLNMIAIYV